MLYDVLSNVLGKERRITASGTDIAYVADFETKEEARLNGDAVNQRISEEGIVLLKNEDVLPLPEGSKISVFGKNSVNLVYGGSGSGQSSGLYTKTLFQSLEGAGFIFNPDLKAFYENNTLSGTGRTANPKMENDGNVILETGETPWANYTADVKNSFNNYKDAALIVISRIGGEGWDLPRSMTDKNGNPVAGARNGDDHYLQLDANETELIKQVANTFEKVIIILNSSATLEVGFLTDPTHYAYHANIDAALWIGAPGDSGIMALGRILKGEVNPSGHLVNTYVKNHKLDPTWQNFGNYLLANGQMYTDIGDKKSNFNYAFVDYEEGIYVGYRYYETRGFTDGEDWYNAHVIYPFGYGLSYTTFNQTIKNKAALEGKNIEKDKDIIVDVEVTNTGTVAGKDAIQIYVTAPYKNGEIEKSHVVLVGVAKSPLIEPGKSATVRVTLEPYAFASYDYNDANNNGFIGYELDGGDYVIRLGKNAHESFDTVTMKVVPLGIKYEKDLVTDNEVVNRFADADDELVVILSRADWAGTWPQPRTAAEKKISAATNAIINSIETNNPNNYDEFPILGEANEVKFQDLVGKDYDDPLWDQLLNNLTADELINLFNKGAFQTIQLNSINKPKTIEADGPTGFVNFMSNPAMGAVYGCASYVCEPIAAATYNPDLLFELGEAVGNEALVGDERGDGAPYSGWYAPGVNLHRSPFGGRVGEYYSEDPFISGIMGSNLIKGVASKGVNTFVKHLAVNEQETTRSGVSTWLDEQTLREIYLKPFEYTVKKGETKGMMSSFNRIGAVWAGGDYRLLYDILRDEWGFKGTVISDFNTGSHMDSRQMAYAGGDLNLQNFGQEWNPKKSSASDMTVLRINAKNILYTAVNSNAVNSEVLGYKNPLWVNALIIFDVIVVAGLAVWGVFAIRGALKKKEDNITIE
jgi:beta-glucosidase